MGGIYVSYGFAIEGLSFLRGGASVYSCSSLRRNCGWVSDVEICKGMNSLGSLGNVEETTREAKSLHQPCRTKSETSYANRDTVQYLGDLQPGANEVCRGCSLRGGMSSKADSCVSCWSINTGGLTGTWRCLHLLEKMEGLQRPQLVFIQEAGCSTQQWLNIFNFVKKIGYTGYATGCRQIGDRVGHAWHRGVVTLIDEQLQANMISEESWSDGQFHLLKVGRTMICNYYVAPREQSIAKQAAMLHESIQMCGWAGPWMWAGDFNEEPMGSWIETLAILLGGMIIDFQDDTHSTRWEGSRRIDHVISNCDQQFASVTTRKEKISDHKILQWRFFIDMKQIEQRRFVNEKNFSKPSWVSQLHWQRLFDEAWKYGEEQQWKEAAKWTDEYQDWPDEDEDGQFAVDMMWTMVCAQLTWAIREAFWLATLAMPMDFEDEREMRRVQHLINDRTIRGVKVHTQAKKRTTKSYNKMEFQRRLYNKIGKLVELEKQMHLGICNSSTFSLARKLYDVKPKQLSIRKVHEDKGRLELLLKETEEKEKNNAIKRWKKDMNHSISKKSSWINKKGSTINAAVQDGDGASMNKMEAVQKMRKYWHLLWERQKWNKQERDQKVETLVNILKPYLEDFKPDAGRPSLNDFRSKVGKVRGSPGADSWAKEDMALVANNPSASLAVWSAMQMWESFNRIPEAVNQCKLVHIPKKELRVLDPGSFRPICILSVWWRIWSTTWLNSGWVKGWATSRFPKNLGGMPGGYGPELLASLISHQVAIRGHAMSLDFKHAFDTVDLTLAQGMLNGILPIECQSWCDLLFRQWRTMKRWIVYDSGVADEPLISDMGLPQGDPCAPICMTLLVYAMTKIVEAKHPMLDLWHVIYMDDRTVVAKEKQQLEIVQSTWHEVAKEFHLIENVQKAQTMEHNKLDSSMEVLGVVLGKPSDNCYKRSRTFGRIQKAKQVYKKLGFLPIPLCSKMEDCGVYCRSLVSYGWIEMQPSNKDLVALRTAMWKSLAKTMHANPHMRQVIGGAHTAMDCTALMRGMRLIAQRDFALMQDGIQAVPCALDIFVQEQLEALGWHHEGELYRHRLCPKGFKFCELTIDSNWKFVAHYIRESYRESQYELYRECGRHEIIENQMVAYHPNRRQLAKLWAKEDSVAHMLLMGAIQSPLYKHRVRGWHTKCHKCQAENPSWDHLWECFTGIIPEDCMMRRHLWPRKLEDFSLCSLFLEGIKERGSD